MSDDDIARRLDDIAGQLAAESGRLRQRRLFTDAETPMHAARVLRATATQLRAGTLMPDVASAVADAGRMTLDGYIGNSRQGRPDSGLRRQEGR